MRFLAKGFLIALCAMTAGQQAFAQDPAPKSTQPATSSDTPAEMKVTPLAASKNVAPVADGRPRTTAVPLNPPVLSARPVEPHMAYMDDPKFIEALALAKEKRLAKDERLARWKHANKIAKNECIECLHQITLQQFNDAQWKDAITSATQLEALASTPNEKYFANSERGLALMRMNDGKPKPDQLKQADESLTAALAIAPKSKVVTYGEGRVLALQGRDAEASAMFQKYVDMVGFADSYRTRAEHFVENPKLAAMSMAPPFTLTTSEGEQMSLDDMGGKVVLIDFWATWCGPCKLAMPEIKKIAKDFAGQPLVVVSISIDRDDIAWKEFITKNQMTWPQYRDANGALANAYSAQSIPRTFTIDTDGVLQAVKVGYNGDSSLEGDLKHLIKKSQDAEKKKAKASERAAN